LSQYKIVKNAICYDAHMRILGIDPGIGRTGWGIIESQSSNVRPLSFGCIETSQHLSLTQRLLQLYQELNAIFQENTLDAVAVEELFFNTNVTTALIVGQARGVILLAAAQNNLEVVAYTPLQVKIAVTGYGRADKKQVEQMIKTILKLATAPKPDDVSDALAIALTHAFSAKLNRR